LGVNLPARLVVIKGTRRYIGSEAEDASGYQEYERSTCLQERHPRRALGSKPFLVVQQRLASAPLFTQPISEGVLV
jgi:hypothetical protein